MRLEVLDSTPARTLLDASPFHVARENADKKALGANNTKQRVRRTLPTQGIVPRLEILSRRRRGFLKRSHFLTKLNLNFIFVECIFPAH